jgi:hypothetical protein
VSYGAPAEGGWPLAARLDVPELRLRDPGGTGWQSAALRLELRVEAPTLLRMRLHGPHLATIGAEPPVPVTADDLSATATLTGTTRIDLSGRGIVAQLPAGRVTLARLEAHGVLDPTGPIVAAHALDIDAAGLLPGVLPPLPPELPPRIARFDLLARLDRSWPGETLTRAAASDWRAAGGRIEVNRLRLLWHRLELDAQSTLRLDAALQPEGAGVLQAGGIPETLQAMSGAGLVPKGQAQAATALLLLRPVGPDGMVSLPLAIRDRTLSVAGFPVLRLPAIAWR